MSWQGTPHTSFVKPPATSPNPVTAPAVAHLDTILTLLLKENFIIYASPHLNSALHYLISKSSRSAYSGFKAALSIDLPNLDHAQDHHRIPVSPLTLLRVRLCNITSRCQNRPPTSMIGHLELGPRGLRSRGFWDQDFFRRDMQ